MPAVPRDGTATGELSLVEVFARADELSTVEADTPGETVALVEYLLALCFAAGAHPESDDDWRAWIIEGRKLAPVAAWLGEQPDEDWDLFHPERPLGQNSLLRKDLARRGAGPAQLILEQAGDYSLHFDHHHLERPEPIPAARAFRAMLTQHVYGLYGRARLSGDELGPRVTNLATARLQDRIRVVALGETLGETLRLNLYPPEGPVGSFNRSWTGAEIERRGFQSKPPPREVTGPADLHSYLGRSILMRPVPGADGGPVAVDRVLIGAGELLALDPGKHLQDAVFAEQSNGQTRPLWPSVTRSLWHEAHALYSAVRDAEAGLYGRLRLLTERTRREGRAPYRLRAIGLVSDKTLAVAWTDGSYPYAPGLEDELCEASRGGSDIAEYLASGLKNASHVARDVTYPNQKPSDKAAQLARFDARTEFWPAARDPFYVLLDDVIIGALVEEALPTYASVLLVLAREYLRRRLDSLPRNSRGNRARALAEQSFEKHLTRAKAPAELRRVSADAP
ncbi:type I-E CRISPR-associated protein Cse1/CasA [Streptomyces sedi]|uniref:Type I-E CRISPR-associated protein Cse1/CasA n=1 Tax=Streptomyces sedi TaxID=555059 RepID=A0A5C4V2V1_9ACTN|nr:type I-E CRISPR-associated protein Cse1/CasA [Streptomyces sedi]TNM30302.1 type I-E CRISPR-associated protein Cse1/CasA [Streptomyces sedi]